MCNHTWFVVYTIIHLEYKTCQTCLYIRGGRAWRERGHLHPTSYEKISPFFPENKTKKAKNQIILTLIGMGGGGIKTDIIKMLVIFSRTKI